MTERSALGASIGFADETTWGTPVAPTLHHKLVSESLQQTIERMNSAGIIAGARVLRSDQWEPGTASTGGDIGLELPTLDAGLLLKHMLGGSSTTGPFTPADLAAGMTVQIGKPDVTDGTVHPHTYSGNKVSSWEVAFSAGEYVTLGLSLAGRHEILHRTVADGATNTNTSITSATAAFDESDVGKPISGTGIPAATTIASVQSATAATISAAATATATGVTFTIGLALTAPSYSAGLSSYGYYDCSVTVAGSAFKVTDGTLAGDNSLKTDRAFAGQRYMDEAIGNDLRAYTGTLNSEYFSDTAYRRFVTGTEAAMVVTFARGTKSMVWTYNVRFDGETPNVGDRGVIPQALPFVALGPSTDAGALTVTLDES